MLKHSYLLASPTQEARCQIRGPHYFVVLDKIRGMNLFPTTTLLSVDLSPASMGGGHFPRGCWGGGECSVAGSLLMTASGPWLATEDHIGAVLWALGYSVTCLITRAQPHIRREMVTSASLGLLCSPHLQVPHLQFWAL